VLLPTYNERENLPLIIWLLDRAFTSSSLAYEVVIVEDSSPDGTYEVAQRLQRVYGEDHIKILKRAGKLGLGSAYKDGLKLATGNFVFLMDADLSHHVRVFVPAPRGCPRPVNVLETWGLSGCLRLCPLPSITAVAAGAVSVTAKVHSRLHQEAGGG
jgi:glycosyltransferase involved in cell wall biosynthesis